MNRLIASVTAGAMFLMSAVPALAAKPVDNLAGVVKVPWNLSGAVMPVPPYGLSDIPGSDTASKLMVNQPNGTIEGVINGAMKGLDPNTTYTVYLSNGYTKYVDTGWNLDGSWNLNFNSTLYPIGNPYGHNLTITGSNATGSSTGNTYNATVSVTGDSVTIVATYLSGSAAFPYSYTATGTISGTGTMSGTWTGSDGDSGNWNSTSGTAVKTHTGDMGWPGLFTGTIPAFTFTTNPAGNGNWHLNLTGENFPGPGTYPMSVWINAGGTVLISDSFTIVI